MLVEASFEIDHACLEMGKLLLLLGDNGQQGHKGVLHKG
jgi:hypothetical protein